MKLIVGVALTALLLAAATATAQSLIDGGDVRNNSLTGKDVKNRSLTLRDFSRSAARALRGPRGRRGPRGFSGAQGIPGAPGANGLNGVTDVSYHDGPVGTVPGDSFGSASASCPPGTVALSVGFGPASGPVLLEHIEIVNQTGGFVLAQTITADPQPVQARVACARR
jgi:hypothetical protein